MFKKFQYFLLIIFSVFNLFFVASSVVATTNTLEGLNKTARNIAPYQKQVNEDVVNFIQTRTGQIIGIVLSFIGVIFLILMLYAGISWMVSGGNQEKVTKSKDLIINSIIGLIIVLAAYATVAFVGNLLTQ